METKTDKVNGFSILRINGRVDTTNYNEFEACIIGLIDRGEDKIIIDCTNLNYISSSGLRVFIIAQKRIMASKGKLHLCSMQASIKEIFDISGFSNIFKIYETEKDALEA